jgi:ABC-type multidrug transport system fused ATPase/permease subunit
VSTCVTEKVSRLNNDITVVSGGLSKNSSIVLRSSLTIIVDIIVMFLLCWELTVTALVGLILIYLWNNVFRKKFWELRKLIQKLRADMTITANESCTNIRTVKAFANEVVESEKFQDSNRKVFDAAMQNNLT